jgi:hypothetical protein
VTDFLDVKRREITERLKELAPLVDEYRRLEAAASALDGVGASSTSSTPAAAATTAAAPRRRGPGRPRGSVNRARKAAPAGAAAAAPTGERKKVGRPPGSGKKVGRPAGKVGRPAGRVGRRKGSGTRAAQALSFVQGQPGITIPELAAKMGIKQNYLYRVLPSLEQEGKLEKKGRGWHPKS